MPIRLDDIGDDLHKAVSPIGEKYFFKQMDSAQHEKSLEEMKAAVQDVLVGHLKKTTEIVVEDDLLMIRSPLLERDISVSFVAGVRD